VQADSRSLAAGATVLGFGGVKGAALAGLDRWQLRLQLLFAIALQLFLRTEA
jgi:hypothetical protein